MTFHLSTRQLRSLERGDHLRIAIPFRGGGDLMAHARASLAVSADWVVDAMPEWWWATACNAEGLTGLMGRLVGVDEATDRMRWRIHILNVGVQAKPNARRLPGGGIQRKPHWPRFVVLDDGDTLPEISPAG